MIAGLGTVPGVGNVFVAAGMDFVHEEVDFFLIKLPASDPADVVDHVAGQGVDFIKTLKVSGYELAGPLLTDVESVVTGYFLRQVMGGFADVVAVGAGAVDLPVEAGGAGLFLEDGFGEGAATDVT